MQDDRNAGSEDTTRNERLVENAADNRDALAAQARRTDATAPPEVNATGAPNQAGSDAGTGARQQSGVANGAQQRAGGTPDQGNEDTERNEEQVRRAAENRDALAAQARKTEETAPPETQADTLPDPHGRDR